MFIGLLCYLVIFCSALEYWLWNIDSTNNV